MVMHARKTHRISDGYFEKHQSHPYQNSKYNSSKSNYSERYGHERMRDSPNGNTYSPDSHSPRDRNYVSGGGGSKHNSSSSYVHKDKERENNRLRDKYSSDCVMRSPKDQRRRENDQRLNHERDRDESLVVHPKLVTPSHNSRDRDIQQRSSKPANSSVCSDKQRSGGEERVTRIGDWSEHISSSGKKYYYNCKTEVSQWEKPREWIIRTQQQLATASHHHPHHHASYSTPTKNTNVHLQEKHSTSLSIASSSSSRILPRPDIKHPNRTGDLNVSGPPRTYWNNSTSGSAAHAHSHHHHPESEKQEDMEICSTPNSTPTSETNYLPPGGGGVTVTTACCTTTNHCEPNASSGVNVSRLSGVTQSKQVDSQSSCQQPVLSSQQQPPPNPIPVLQSSSALLSPPESVNSNKTNSSNIIVVSSVGTCNSVSSGDAAAASTTPLVSLKVDTNSVTTCDPGPPTPTHSESQQPPPLLSSVDIRKQNSSPIATAPSSSLSSLTSSVIHAMRPQAPTVNPALANHYREDLTAHVRGWPADVYEKQAQKMSEESNHISMHLCRVSAELKSARAIVRNSEIQATIQEQRILFLRQQIQRLEEMKSQNSYMSATDENVLAVNRVKK